MRLDEGLVKQLTGGDKVTARFLYENEFDFMPQFKLWMATNHKPIIRGTDDGIWRRMAIIPFTVQIPKEKVDKRLKHKLRRELKAILHWAVEGYI
ncbi:DNA primase, partial [Bacillus toyonensis]